MASVRYKLFYFKARGVGETIRMILTYMGENFDDIRLSQSGSAWAEFKTFTPFGNLPVLEIDGKKYSQAVPLYRYLGKKAELGGDNALEDFYIDMIADELIDLQTDMVALIKEMDVEAYYTKKINLITETLPFYLNKLEETVQNNGGYLANGKLSWVDFMFVSTFENFGVYLNKKQSLFEDYPTLEALRVKVTSLPNVKAWLEIRPGP